MASLRTQTFWVTVLTKILLVGCLFVVLDRVALTQFNRIEQKVAEEEILRALDAFDAALHHMAGLAGDLAVWDETVRFMEDRNESYLRNNLGPAYLEESRLNLVLFFKPDGALFHSVCQGASAEPLDAPPAGLLEEHLHPQSILLRRDGRIRGAAGLVVLTETGAASPSVVMLASRPITRSDLGGTPAGTLVIGRLLTDAEVQHVVRNPRWPFRLLNGTELAEDDSLVFHGDRPVATRHPARDVIEAVGRLKDVYGRSSLYLATRKPREIYDIGSRFVMTGSLLVVGVLGLAAGLQFFLLDRRVLSRMTRFGRRMNEISHTSDVSVRLDESGKDELARLAHDINRMLNTVEVAQRRLQESESRLNTILQSVQDGVMVVDAVTQRVLGANRQALHLLGLPREKVLGASCRGLFRAAHSDETVCESHWTVTNIEARLICADDTSIPILLSALPVPIEGRPCFVVNFADIREEKRMQADLARAKEQAEAASRAKSMFLANMSHEIRTPMNAVLGFAQILHEDPTLGEDQRRSVRTILNSGEHLLALINSILEMSKIESGSIQAEPRAFDLNAMLEGLEGLLRSRAARKALSLKFITTGSVPRYLVADEGRVRQILVNLLDNALKFTERGHVHLRVAWQAAAHEQPARLVFDVEDTGPGIAEEDRTRLFQPFMQSRHGMEARGGTGLGLAISRQYARLLKGDIELVSHPGAGCVFRVEIPVLRAETSAAGQETPPRLGRIAGARRPRVLVVDDEAANRLLVTHLLQHAGFEVREAAGGAEALTLVPAWKPELVLLDLAMPGVDGYEVLARLRAGAATRDLPVIVLTAHAFEEDRKRVMEAGANGFLRKPFRLPQLLDLIGRALHLAIEPAAPAAAPAAAHPPPADAALLPAALRERIGEAARLADVDHLDLLAAEVEALDPDLGARLRSLMARFEYDAIVSVFAGADMETVA